jgi:arylsulfatase B
VVQSQCGARGGEVDNLVMPVANWTGDMQVVVPPQKTDDSQQATSSGGDRHNTRAPPPHIVTVLVDDWGWRDGPSAIRPGNGLLTPTMNTLLSEGINLDRMYAYRYCSPTRSSLLSGRLPIHVNQLNLKNNQRGGGINANMTTIANKLTSAGYFCAAVGKWHCGMTHPSLVPGRRGFAYSLGYLAGSEDHFQHFNQPTGCAGESGHTPLIDMFQTNAPVLNAHKLYAGLYNGFLFGNTAVELIRNASVKTKPLFLYLAFANCHHPMQAPPQWLNLYSAIPDAPPANLRRKTYQAMTTFVDAALANVTQALKEGEMWANTLLIVVGDNGGPSLTDLDTSNNFPLRGGKYSLFDGGNRVNAFVSGGVIPSAMHGTTIDALIHVADLYATFCHLAGVSAAERHDAVDEEGRLLPPVESVNLWPLLSGTNRQQA